MPFSLLLQGYPTSDVPVAQVQGPALQGMFLHLMSAVDPAMAERLHHEDNYRPYTLSPLGIGDIPPLRGARGVGIPLLGGARGGFRSPLREGRGVGIPPLRGARGVFSAFRLPQDDSLRKGTPCYLRITMLVDDLFAVFGRYFLERSEPTFRLGETEFVVTGILEEHTPLAPLKGDLNPPLAPPRRGMHTPLAPLKGGMHTPLAPASTRSGQAPGREMTPPYPPQRGIQWTQYRSYAELINTASCTHRKIVLRFLTPTGFRRGDVDFSLPDPRLVFRSYQKRFEEFHHFEFRPDLAEQIELHVGVSNLKHLETSLMKTKNIPLGGFTGRVTYQIDRKASPDLIFQMNLLADYAFFCGTGRKTTVGMGQTVRVDSRQ